MYRLSGNLDKLASQTTTLRVASFAGWHSGGFRWGWWLVVNPRCETALGSDPAGAGHRPPHEAARRAFRGALVFFIQNHHQGQWPAKQDPRAPGQRARGGGCKWRAQDKLAKAARSFLGHGRFPQRKKKCLPPQATWPWGMPWGHGISRGPEGKFLYSTVLAPATHPAFRHCQAQCHWNHRVSSPKFKKSRLQ